MNATDSKFYGALCEAAGEGNVFCQEPMSRHTTFRIGGPAEFFATPKDPESLQKVLRLCRQEGYPRFILGNGSNLLVSDDGCRGVVVQLDRNFQDVRCEETRITAQAGVLLSKLAALARDNSLAGLEFASGIPGSLGGALAMNAGAYGGEMKDVLRSVTVLDGSLEFRTVPVGELDMGYRCSRIQTDGWVAVSAVLDLTRGERGEIDRKMEELREKRAEKQPLAYPSAGSTFKRPEGYFAGKLIMDAGLAGYTVGGAQVSEKHCGFVINRGGATAADVRTLIGDVQRIVYEKFGVKLEPEVRFLGF